MTEGERAEGVPPEIRQVEFWLSPGEAARVVGVSATYMTVMARQGNVEAIRTTLGWLFNPPDVQRFAKERRVKKAKKGAAK